MNKQAVLHDAIVGALAPAVLEVIDESSMHSVPKGAQTHFKVVIVSDAFAGRSLVARHRLVNEACASLVGKPGGVHALSIHALTPDEWSARGGEIPKSPPCLGGSKAG
jgi:BolA protein